MKRFNFTSTSKTVFTNNGQDINREDKMSDTDCGKSINATSDLLTIDKSDVSFIADGFDLNNITNPGIYTIKGEKLIVPFRLGITVYLLRDKSHPIDKWMKNHVVMHRFSNLDDQSDVRLVVLTVNAVLYNNDGLSIIPKENTDAIINVYDELLFTNTTTALEKMIEMTKGATDIITEFGNK